MVSHARAQARLLLGVVAWSVDRAAWRDTMKVARIAPSNCRLTSELAVASQTEIASEYVALDTNTGPAFLQHGGFT
jgi:hypothetical protein